jgi:plastocyanin
MRSNASLVLVTVTLLLFAACSPSATATPTAAPTTAATPTTPAASATPTTAPAGTPTPAPSSASGACTTTTGGTAVTIAGFAFSPTPLNVTAGTTVTWTNQDNTTHTATSDDGKTFDCKPISSGTSMSFTFTTPGTYDYHCAIHPTMKARIVVS